MKSIVCSGLIAITLLGTASAAETDQQESTTPHATRHGVGHTVLFYIPNRVFDVLDIVRARVRLGPGLAVGARVTKLTDVFLGGYNSVFFGLPGPRQAPKVPVPFGPEARSGVAVSVADATVTDYDANPRYADTEVGAGVHVAIIGAEVGVDPAEVFDLLFGIFLIDFREDDM